MNTSLINKAPKELRGGGLYYFSAELRAAYRFWAMPGVINCLATVRPILKEVNEYITETEANSYLL
jgi:hypothetical protein